MWFIVWVNNERAEDMSKYSDAEKYMDEIIKFCRHFKIQMGDLPFKGKLPFIRGCGKCKIPTDSEDQKEFKFNQRFETTEAIKEKLKHQPSELIVTNVSDIEMEPMNFQLDESDYQETILYYQNGNYEEIFKKLEELIEKYENEFNKANFETETMWPFQMKALIFFASALFEDGVQSTMQYLFFEKYLTALDPFIFFNGLLAVYTSVMFLKGIII